MNSRKVRRGHGAGLGPRKSPPSRTPPPPPRAGGKKGWCEFAIPLAAARTAVALGQLALVNWQIRGVR